MKRKLHYETPAIRREVILRTEGEILAGSIVENADVRSVGQEVVDIDDFSGSEFTYTWGE
jgi:hypothetical protein